MNMRAQSRRRFGADCASPKSRRSTPARGPFRALVLLPDDDAQPASAADHRHPRHRAPFTHDGSARGGAPPEPRTLRAPPAMGFFFRGSRHRGDWRRRLRDRRSDLPHQVRHQASPSGAPTRLAARFQNHAEARLSPTTRFRFAWNTLVTEVLGEDKVSGLAVRDTITGGGAVVERHRRLRRHRPQFPTRRWWPDRSNSKPTGTYALDSAHSTGNRSRPFFAAGDVQDTSTGRPSRRLDRAASPRSTPSVGSEAQGH